MPAVPSLPVNGKSGLICISCCISICNSAARRMRNSRKPSRPILRHKRTTADVEQKGFWKLEPVQKDQGPLPDFAEYSFARFFFRIRKRVLFFVKPAQFSYAFLPFYPTFFFLAVPTYEIQSVKNISGFLFTKPLRNRNIFTDFSFIVSTRFFYQQEQF